MKIGYARISTQEQNLDLQIQSLTREGCDRIFADTISGSIQKRPELAKALDTLKAGDTLVVWKLDRLGRTIVHLITMLKELEDNGIHFHSITDGFDTSTPSGRLMMHITGAFAEFERSIIIERTRAGLDAARARGVKLGRRYRLKDSDWENVKTLIESGQTVRAICNTLNVSRTCYYEYVTRMRTEGENK